MFLSGIFAITVLTTPRWAPGYILGTVFLTLALVWVPAALAMGRSRRTVSRMAVAGAAIAVVFFAVVLGRAQQVQYAEHHYTKTTLFLGEGGPQDAYAFAQKKKDTKIGIIGSSEIIFGQYGFYGNDASNHVEYIGVRGPHGSNRLPEDCRTFRRLINEGDYEYLIISQATQDSPAAEYFFPIYRWIKDDPALELVLEEPEIIPQPDYVFKVNGELDPAGCAAVAGAG